MPVPTAAENASGRKIKILFPINFLVEIILLDMVAFFMRVRAFIFCAVAMMPCAAIAVLLIRIAASFRLITAVEALMNAAIWWSTAGFRIKKTVVPVSLKVV